MIVSKSDNLCRLQFLYLQSVKVLTQITGLIQLVTVATVILHSELSTSLCGPVISILELMFNGYVLSITIKNLKWKYISLILKEHCFSMTRVWRNYNNYVTEGLSYKEA